MLRLGWTAIIHSEDDSVLRIVDVVVVSAGGLYQAY
jgi:hypothetical protein